MDFEKPTIKFTKIQINETNINDSQYELLISNNTCLIEGRVLQSVHLLHDPEYPK